MASPSTLGKGKSGALKTEYCIECKLVAIQNVVSPLKKCSHARGRQRARAIYNQQTKNAASPFPKKALINAEVPACKLVTRRRSQLLSELILDRISAPEALCFLVRLSFL